MQERSITGLLGLVLAGLLVAGAAIAGLAAVSMWSPAAGSVVVPFSVRGDHETRSFEIWDRLPCCHKTQ